MFIGDSIMSGSKVRQAYTSTGSLDDIESSMPYIVSQALGYTYQNVGVGSQRTAQISARFAEDIVNQNTKRVFINGGVNDINTGDTEQDILNNYTSILDSTAANGIEAYVMAVLPWTAGGADKMRIVDSVNASLEALVDTYANATWINPTATLGVFRPGGDAGNLWDQNPAYVAADNIHWNAAGYAAMANYILSIIN